MNIVTLALKDLRLILRDKLGAFFILVFPVLLGVFFGLVMGGISGFSRGKITVAVVDLDQSPWSKNLLEELAKNTGIALEPDELDAAKTSVRLGRRAALMVIPKGFGETAGVLWQEQAEIQLGLDPSRVAEAAMLEGFLMQASAALVAKRFRDPTTLHRQIEEIRKSLSAPMGVDPMARMLGEFLERAAAMIESADRLRRANEQSEGDETFRFRFANIRKLDISEQEDTSSLRAQLKKIRSRWDISFPQGMIWGIMGCAACFASSIAREDARGTLVRLRAAPLSKGQILLGKALACLSACLMVVGLLTFVGTLLGMRSDDYVKLAVGAVAVSLAFVGIMMTMSVLSRTEEGVSGSGWAINTVMAMIGGGMVPPMFMPSFLQALSGYSPVFWAIRLFEGAIWRQFTWGEMLVPIAILLSIGLAGMVLGTTILIRRYR